MGWRTYMLIHRQQAERWERHTHRAWCGLKAYPKWHTSSDNPSNPSQTVPLLLQASKYLGLWGPFSFESLQSPSCFHIFCSFVFLLPSYVTWSCSLGLNMGTRQWSQHWRKLEDSFHIPAFNSLHLVGRSGLECSSSGGSCFHCHSWQRPDPYQFALPYIPYYERQAVFKTSI